MALSAAEKQARYRERCKVRLQAEMDALRTAQAPADFEDRVRLASKQWLEEVRLPIYEKQIEDLMHMLEYPRNAVMTRAEYNIILKCLHPDAGNNRSPEQLGEAFRLFTKYRLKMASDPEARRAGTADLPKSREELLARKRKRA